MREGVVEQALRHVRESETHVERQEQIVQRLREDGHSTGPAEELLGEFERSLELHRSHLKRILAER